MNAQQPDIGNAHVAAFHAIPDYIYEDTILAGRPYRSGRPNYDKPGMGARVEREAFYAECAANPPTSSFQLLMRLRELNRLESGLAQQRGAS